MRPVIAIMGRPNVGKSTLFNRLTRSRDALVAAGPGLTRDRIYGAAIHRGRAYLAVDTGGLSDDPRGLGGLVTGQALRAVQGADLVLFVVDAREGLTSRDESIAIRLRSLGRPIQVVVNKAEAIEDDSAIAEFHSLGLGQPVAVSSAHGQGMDTLLDLAFEALPRAEAAAADEDGPHLPGIKIAVVGRPNVGKSTLVNRILGEERVLVYDQPGTTRDSVFAPFRRHQKDYVLIDTAGIRRRARISEAIEQFSVIKTLQTIERAHVVVLVIDATESVTEQDAALLGLIVQSGRGLVIAINKWDGLGPDQREHIQKETDRRLRFLDYAAIHTISARHGSGVGNLFASIDLAYASAFIDVPPATLTRIVEQAVALNPPPLIHGRRIKLRYAHLGGHNPPRILIHGNRGEHVPSSYRRYLERSIRKALGLQGTPLCIEFRQGENPFKSRHNPLTRRQTLKRKRLLRHVRSH